jgi:hypothetical protein
VRPPIPISKITRAEGLNQTGGLIQAGEHLLCKCEAQYHQREGEREKKEGERELERERERERERKNRRGEERREEERKQMKRRQGKAWCWWLMPLILAIWGTEI